MPNGCRLRRRSPGPGRGIDPGRHRRPVAVDLAEVVPAVRHPPGDVDRDVQVRPAGRLAPAAVGLLPGPAAWHRAVPGQPARRVGQRRHVPGQPRIQPGLGDVRRVDREPLPQRHPGRLGAARQLVDLRPRALGVDVVGRERRDPAPVVDPGGQDELVGVPDQVGRGLDPRRRAEHQPGHRDRRGQVVELGIGHGAHLRVRFGPEVLNDNFLDTAVLLRDPPDGEDRVRPLGQRLTDADQDAGGERDRRPARVLQHPQPHGRVLVRAAVVRPAPVGEQPGRRGLQHHPHRGRHRLEPGEVLPGEHARVQVRQQAGLLQHPDGHGPHVGQGVVVAAGAQPVPRLPPAVLGPVAEREQRLLAAERRALAGDREHLVRGEVGAVQPAGHGDEGAVAAPVPAEPGQRDEHLARIGDDTGAPGGREPRVADPAGVRQQGGQLLAAGMHQRGRLARVQRLAVPGAGQRAADGTGRRRGPLRRAGRRTGGGQVAHTGTLSPGSPGLLTASPLPRPRIPAPPGRQPGHGGRSRRLGQPGDPAIRAARSTLTAAERPPGAQIDR